MSYFCPLAWSESLKQVNARPALLVWVHILYSNEIDMNCLLTCEKKNSHSWATTRSWKITLREIFAAGNKWQVLPARCGFFRCPLVKDTPKVFISTCAVSCDKIWFLFVERKCFFPPFCSVSFFFRQRSFCIPKLHIERFLLTKRRSRITVQ